MKTWLGAATAAVAATVALAATPAAAVVYTVTYTGVVAPGGYDNLNTFGVGTNLSGQAFTMSFKVNTLTPGASTRADGAYAQFLEGYDAAAPVEGWIKIGNTTLSFGDQYGYDYRYDNDLNPACLVNCEAGMEQWARNTSFSEVNGLISSGGRLGYARAYGYAGQFAGLGHGPPADAAGATHFYGNFSSEQSTFTRADPGNKTYTQQINAALKISSVAIPEPATWALMILGFGAVGVSLRRRSSADAAFG